MKLTKTWLSYIMWGIFSIVFFADIGIAAIEIYLKTESREGFLIPVVSMYLYVIAGIALLIVLYKLYERFLLPKIGKETFVLEGAFEFFAFAIFLFVAVAVRVVAVISATEGLEGLSAFYEFATSSASEGFPGVYSNGVYVYGYFLKFVLAFLGHIPMAAMVVQTVLQILTIIVLYLVVKKAIGRLEAWVCCVLFAYLPGSILAVRNCTPDALYVLFISLYFLGLVYLCEANRKQRIRSGGCVFYYIAIGVGAAFLSYFDIVGLLMVIITIVALIQFKNVDAEISIQKSGTQITIFVLSFIVALALMICFLPCNGLGMGAEALMGYFRSFIPDYGLNLMILSPHKGSWDCLVLFIFSGVWFAGFLRDKKDKAFPFVLIVVALTICSFFNIGTYEYSGLASFAWIMVASFGITSLNAFGHSKTETYEEPDKAKPERTERKYESQRERGKEQVPVAMVRNDKPVKNGLVSNTRRQDNQSAELKPVKVILSDENDINDGVPIPVMEPVVSSGIGRRTPGYSATRQERVNVNVNTDTDVLKVENVKENNNADVLKVENIEENNNADVLETTVVEEASFESRKVGLESEVKPEPLNSVQESNVATNSVKDKNIAEEPVKEMNEQLNKQPVRKPKMIRNPLPGPKPHVAKELNYDYEPADREMEFDIVDITGKDYFDL